MMLEYTPESSAGNEPRTCRVKVLGVGGAGCNAVDRMAFDSNKGIATVAINTDAQVLASSVADLKVQIGRRLTRGLGAGGDPDIGYQAALEDIEQIERVVEGADLIFLVTGLGGGTGTGASPEVARAAKAAGALVLAFATLPFRFEGQRRMVQAREGLNRLQSAVDTVILVPNDRLMDLVEIETSMLDAFRKIDDLLAQCVQSIYRMLTATGLINLDFADLRAVLSGAGHGACAFGFGEATGPNRAAEAVEAALGGPLLNKGFSLETARSLLVHVIGGPDLSLFQMQQVMDTAVQYTSQDVRVFYGACIDEDYAGRIAVTILAADAPAVKALEEEMLPLTPPAEAVQPPPAAGEALAEAATPAPAGATTPGEAAAGQLRRTRRRSRSRARTSEEVVAQGVLPLDTPPNSMFDQGEPTMLGGQNLDVPTFLRWRVKLVGTPAR